MARFWLPAILLAGAAVRLGHWWALRQGPFVAFPIMDSAVYLEWGRAIAAGDWLGQGEFFLAPLYPYVLAAMLALGGSVDTVYLAQITAAVLGLLALYRAGSRLESARIGLLAAALAALCGPLVFHDVLLVKESFAASLTAGLLATLLRPDLEIRLRPWLLAGTIWGLVGLLRENAILLLPFLAGAIWIRRPRPRPFLGALGALLAGYALVALPFVARSLAVTGSPFPTFNAGFNLYIGNNPRATGTYQPIVPGKTLPEAEGREPVRVASELVGRKLTPGQASRYWTGRSLAWMVEEPRAFLRLQARKLGLYWRFYEWPDSVDYYWAREESPALRLAFVELGGLALLAAGALWVLRRRLRPWAPVLLLVVGWTAATVAFFVFSRFRVPMLPALCLLAAVPVERTLVAFRAGRHRAAVVGAALVTLALLFPHALGHEPDRNLVAYNLAGVLAETGDLEGARQAYLEALAAAPDDFAVMLRLGDLALGQGRLPEAAAWYERATRARPEADDPWAQYGRVLALQGQGTLASQALERALALNPENITALYGQAHLALLRRDVPRAEALRHHIAEIAPDHAAVRLLDRLLRETKARTPEPPEAETEE
jgi:tetratricopeptide (TPR) repeat protein